MSQFFYTRVAQVAKKDENGQVIPLKDEKGNVIPKKFETEPKEFIDSFNTDKIIRTHMMSEDHVVVLLDDGHESVEPVPAMEKGKVVQKNQRIWVQSEISVKGADVARLHEFLKK